MTITSLYGAVPRDRARERLVTDLGYQDQAIRAVREDLHKARQQIETIPIVLAALQDMQGSLKAQLAILDAIDATTRSDTP